MRGEHDEMDGASELVDGTVASDEVAGESDEALALDGVESAAPEDVLPSDMASEPEASVDDPVDDEEEDEPVYGIGLDEDEPDVVLGEGDRVIVERDGQRHEAYVVGLSVGARLELRDGRNTQLYVPASECTVVEPAS